MKEPSMQDNEAPVLDTGRKRALARLAERARFVQEYYKDTVFPLNLRAERRRTLKALKRHERAMEIRKRFRSVKLPKHTGKEEVIQY